MTEETFKSIGKGLTVCCLCNVNVPNDYTCKLIHQNGKRHQQKLTQSSLPKPMITQNLALLVAKRVVLERFDILKKTAPQIIVEIGKYYELFQQESFDAYFSQIEADYDDLAILFISDLMVAASRVWEAFGLDEDQHSPRFPEWINRKSDVLAMILSNWHRVEITLTKGVEIQELGKEDPNIMQAFENVKNIWM